jgi:hypothetical protein
MATHKIDNFNENAEPLFRLKLEKYGYQLDRIIVFYIKGEKWSTHHIYINNIADLKIIIKQEPYYSDYGFSVFIFKLGTEEYNILYHVPHEIQDKEDKFLYKAYNDLFSSQEILDLISGKFWKEFKYILFDS